MNDRRAAAETRPERGERALKWRSAQHLAVAGMLHSNGKAARASVIAVIGQPSALIRIAPTAQGAGLGVVRATPIAPTRVNR